MAHEDQSEERLQRRRDALAALDGSRTGVYPLGYLEALRAEWDAFTPDQRDEAARRVSDTALLDREGLQESLQQMHRGERAPYVYADGRQSGEADARPGHPA